jgi:hypothetical protein
MSTQEADAAITGTSEAEASDDPEVIREQIEATRAELGETVEALAAKADVKAQVKEKVAVGKEEARAVVTSLPARVKQRPLPVIALAGVLVGWLIWKRR